MKIDAFFTLSRLISSSFSQSLLSDGLDLRLSCVWNDLLDSRLLGTSNSQEFCGWVTNHPGLPWTILVWGFSPESPTSGELLHLGKPEQVVSHPTPESAFLTSSPGDICGHQVSTV